MGNRHKGRQQHRFCRQEKLGSPLFCKRLAVDCRKRNSHCNIKQECVAVCVAMCCSLCCSVLQCVAICPSQEDLHLEKRPLERHVFIIFFDTLSIVCELLCMHLESVANAKFHTQPSDAMCWCCEQMISTRRVKACSQRYWWMA